MSSHLKLCSVLENICLLTHQAHAYRNIKIHPIFSRHSDPLYHLPGEICGCLVAKCFTISCNHQSGIRRRADCICSLAENSCLHLDNDNFSGSKLNQDELKDA